MIFTAVQVLRSQTSSQEFKAYGAENLAPAVVSASRIVAYPTDPNGFERRRLLIEHLSRMVAAKAGSAVQEKFTYDGQGISLLWKSAAKHQYNKDYIEYITCHFDK